MERNLSHFLRGRDAPAVNEVQNPPASAVHSRKSLGSSKLASAQGAAPATSTMRTIVEEFHRPLPVEPTGVKGDGRNLLAASELRSSRRQARVLAPGHYDKLDRRQEFEVERGGLVSVMGSPEDFLFGGVGKSVQNTGVATNNGRIDNINIGVTTIKVENCSHRQARWIKTLASIRDEVDKEFLAESSTNTNERGKEYWEVRDARRVARGEVGFYKFAKMLGEGKLSQYDQNGYWQSIARKPKHQVVTFLNASSGAAMYNLTEHMRRSVAISLDRRKNYFDESCREEVITFIRFLRCHPTMRQMHGQMVAQAGFSFLPVFTHKVHLGVDPLLIEQLCKSEFDGLSKVVMSTITLIGAFYSSDRWAHRIWAFAQYLVGFDATREVLFMVIRRAPQLSQAFFSPNMEQAQSGGSQIFRHALDALESEGESIWSALASVLASAFKVEIPSDTWRNATRAKRFANIATVIASIDKMFEALRKVIELAREGIQAYAHGMSISQWRLSSISAYMPMFAAKVTKAYENGGPNLTRQDPDRAQLALEFFREGSRYMEVVSGGGASPSQFAAFQAVWKMVMELYQAAQDYFLTHTEREPPFVIHFLGSTGVGKSRLSQHIVGDIAREMGLEYNKAFDHYFRNVQTPYWEGYTYQKVVFYDDFMQNPNLVGKECEELIRIVNNAPYLLNMAQADLKGKTLFTSPFVVLSSNKNVPDHADVADVNAVKRRRDVVLKVNVKAEFVDQFGSVNLEKLEHRGQHFENHIYTFTLLDSRTHAIVEEINSYSELVMYLVERVRRKMPTLEERRNSVVRRLIEDGLIEESDNIAGMTWWQKIGQHIRIPAWLSGKDVTTEQDSSSEQRPIAIVSSSDDESGSLGTSVSVPLEGECIQDDPYFHEASEFMQIPPSSDDERAGVRARKTTHLHAIIKFYEEELFWHPASQLTVQLPEWQEFASSTAAAWWADELGDAIDPRMAMELVNTHSLAQFRERFNLDAEMWLKWIKTLYRAWKMHQLFLWQNAKKQAEEEKSKIRRIDWAMGILVIVMGTVHVARYFMQRRQRTTEAIEHYEPESGAFASGDERTRASQRKVQIKSITELQSAQSSRDPRALELVKTKFASAMCLVRFIKDEGSVGVHGILIGGKLIAVPYHLFATTPEAIEVEVITTTSVFKCGAGDIYVRTDWKCVDLMVIVMPNHFPSYPKLVHHFVEQADLERYNLGDVAMLMMVSNGDHAMPYFQVLRNVRRSGEHSYVASGDRTEHIHIVDSLRYQAETRFGDCGAPLVWFHPSVSRKILGFHVAGGQNTGASNILTKELMSQVFDSVPTTRLASPTLEDGIPTLQEGVANIGQMAYMGLMDKQRQFRQPSESDIIKSVIHGAFPVITKPAALKVVDGVSPLELGVRKSCQANCILPREDLETVLDQVYDHYVDKMDRMAPFVLSVEEGLNGVAGNEWIKPLNMTTSPGFPWITGSRKLPGKLDFVAKTEDGWVPLDKLRIAIERRIEMAKRREIPETVFVDVLKDERRELEKVEALKTRIFNTCPMDLNIAIRMYFGHLASLVMDNHVDKEIAVGINCHGESWRALYMRLKSNGPNWIAGDYSNYDKTFPRQLMMMVAHIANRFYADGNDVIRETLMESLCCRVHLANRVVYFQTHGNPSGNVLTTIINSFGNMALMRLAWLSLARKYDPELELDFADHVALSVYGDDNVATVSTRARWFTMNNIAQSLAPWGVVYTPPKIGNHESPDFIPLDEITYLKRRFLRYNGLVLAPLPKDRIRETCNWIRKCPDEVQATIDNIFMAQLEMFHWGREEYALFQQELREISRKYQISPKLVPWNVFLVKYTQGTLHLCLECPTKQDLNDGAPNHIVATWEGEADPQPRPGLVGVTQMVAQANQHLVQHNNCRLAPSTRGPNIKVETGKEIHLLGASKRVVNNMINVSCPQRHGMVAEAGKKIFKSPVASKMVESTKKPKTAKLGAQVKPKMSRNAVARSSTNVRATTISTAPIGAANNTVVVAVPTEEKAFAVPSQDKRAELTGKELLTRVDGPRIALAFSLVPGFTSAQRLDHFVRNYGWTQWMETPVIHHRSLTSIANNGVWYYRVLHDATMKQILDANNWVTHTSAFIAQKSHVDFKIPIPVSAMVNKRSSPQNTERGSYVLLVYEGDDAPQSEFWLHYRVQCGGVSASGSPPVTYKVENGIFYDPSNNEPLKGIPLAADGKTTHYNFTPPLSDRQMTKEFVDIQGGVPITVVRADVKPVVDKNSSAAELTLTHPQRTISQQVRSAVDIAKDVAELAGEVTPIARTVVRKLGQAGPWIARVLGAIGKRSLDDCTEHLKMSGPFAEYNGFVTVYQGWRANDELSAIESMVPIVVSDDHEQERSLRLLNFAFPLATRFGVQLLGRAARVLSKALKLAHKGTDAINFTHGTPGGFESNVDDGTNTPGDEGGNIMDPELPENPLPDVPDFGDDETAPGEIIKWETTNRHVGGFVVDNNGTPIVKWMGATYAKMPLHISAPGPKFYSMDKMPWDKESKRMLSCYVEVDREMAGYYLLLQCVNWGDDAAGHWVRDIHGGTYFGTVARFGGLAESRSVVRVDDVGQWNAHPVHLYIGQSKFKYFSEDDGRACIFYLSVGAVKSAQVAEKFLSAYDSSGSQALVNTYVEDKGKEYKTSEFSSVTDAKLRSRATTLPAGLEPLAPGFSQNLVSFMQAGGGTTTRTLPITVEAGPIRGLLLARYDEENGWWQHVPYCALSYTSLSSRWKCAWLMGDSNTSSRYKRGNSQRGSEVPALRITPPSALTSGAYCCAEVFTLSGDNNYRAQIVTTDDSTNLGTWTVSQQASAIPTPISCYRIIFPAQAFDIVAVGDTAQPTTAVASRSGDEYLTIGFTVYLVKDFAAAKQWVRHELDVAAYIDPNTSDAKKEDYNYSTIRCYKCEKDSTGAYMPVDSPTWAPCRLDECAIEAAPLTSRCPLFSVSGRGATNSKFLDKPWLFSYAPNATHLQTDVNAHEYDAGLRVGSHTCVDTDLEVSVGSDTQEDVMFDHHF